MSKYIIDQLFIFALNNCIIGYTFFWRLHFFFLIKLHYEGYIFFLIITFMGLHDFFSSLNYIMSSYNIHAYNLYI
jgi:hypothetical protein